MHFSTFLNFKRCWRRRSEGSDRSNLIEFRSRLTDSPRCRGHARTTETVRIPEAHIRGPIGMQYRVAYVREVGSGPTGGLTEATWLRVRVPYRVNIVAWHVMAVDGGSDCHVRARHANPTPDFGSFSNAFSSSARFTATPRDHHLVTFEGCL